MSFSINDLNLTKEHNVFVYKCALRSSSWFMLITLLTCLIAIVPLLLIKINNMVTLAIFAFILTFAIFLVISRFFLLRSITKPLMAYRLTFTKDNNPINFRPHAWRWFWMVSGVQLLFFGCMAVLIYLSVTLPDGIGIGFAFSTYYLATYILILHLIRAGDATIQSVTS